MTPAATPGDGGWRTPAATCAFERCQAGGAILPGAPRHMAPTAAQPWFHNGVLMNHDVYHPGCWAAEQHQRATGGAK